MVQTGDTQAEAPRPGPGFIYFYLRTENGERALAAVGTDHGNAKYTYATQPGFQHFGPLHTSTNRKEVVRWLEAAIRMLRAPRRQQPSAAENAQKGAATGEGQDDLEGLYFVDIQCASALAARYELDLQVACQLSRSSHRGRPAHFRQ
jgi:hypothetical protein